MSDPFLFDENDASIDEASLRLRDKLLETGYREDGDSNHEAGHRPMKRVLKWLFLVCFGIFASSHIYAIILRWAPPPATIIMADRALAGEDVRRAWVPLEEMSPHLVIAVIASEDQRFCDHSGVDTEAIRKAYQEYKDGEGLRGGSTITQQTAKNVFLWNGGGIVRKLPEAWMAYMIDAVWGKRRVMEVYLNVAEWGDGLFGAEAAARVRFGKHAKDLTAYEAALLATVLPSPNKWRVDPPGPYVQQRTQRTLRQMNNVQRDGLAACVLK